MFPLRSRHLNLLCGFSRRMVLLGYVRTSHPNILLFLLWLLPCLQSLLQNSKATTCQNACTRKIHRGDGIDDRTGRTALRRQYFSILLDTRSNYFISDARIQFSSCNFADRRILFDMQAIQKSNRQNIASNRANGEFVTPMKIS